MFDSCDVPVCAPSCVSGQQAGVWMEWGRPGGTSEERRGGDVVEGNRRNDGRVLVSWEHGFEWRWLANEELADVSWRVALRRSMRMRHGTGRDLRTFPYISYIVCSSSGRRRKGDSGEPSQTAFIVACSAGRGERGSGFPRSLVSYIVHIVR